MIGVGDILAVATASGAALGGFIGLIHPSSDENVRQLLTNVALGGGVGTTVGAASGITTYIGLKLAGGA